MFPLDRHRPDHRSDHRSARRGQPCPAWRFGVSAVLLALLALAGLPASAQPDGSSPAGDGLPEPGGRQASPGQGDRPGAEPWSGLPEATGEGADGDAGEEADGTAETAHLPPEHRNWLRDVRYLISDKEKEIFLELPRDYQRNAFIDRFWQERDPFPETARNELRERWTANLAEVQLAYAGESYEWWEDDRALIYLFHGPPTWRCRFWKAPMELWFYEITDRSLWGDSGLPIRRVPLWFFQSRWQGPYHLATHRLRSAAAPQQRRPPFTFEGSCNPEQEAIAAEARGRWEQDYRAALRTLMEPPDPPGWEWATVFRSYSTELAEGSAQLAGRLEVEYPGLHQSRTVVQGTVALAEEQLTAATPPSPDDETPPGHYNLELHGEIVAEDYLFDSFRYRFELPAGVHAASGEAGADGAAEVPVEVPVVFERYLRPGEYRLIVKVEDLRSGGVFRTEETITVPSMPIGPEARRRATAAGEANQEWMQAAFAELEGPGDEASGDVARVELIEALGHNDQIRTGYQNLAARVAGEAVDHVVFYLDGKHLLRRNRPPYEVDLDLGRLPRVRLLRVVAYDEEGRELAADEKVINATRERFAVRWIAPRQGEHHPRTFRAEVEVDVPRGRAVERVELLLNDEPIATLYQPPFVHTVTLPEVNQLAYLQARAFLPDGASTDAVVIVNAPDYLEEIQVRMVELYTTVVDGRGRQVRDLTAESFRVFEDGEEQELARFERVEDLPLALGILLDSSGSMEERLDASRLAAESFLETAMTPRDRAAVMVFNDYPTLAVPFTDRLDKLLAGLLGLRAERGTALYDSVIFALHQLGGVPGQRAVLLLSDGTDEHSQFTEEEALELARRAGITVYTIGLDLPKKPKDARRFLEELAAQTGGRSFFLDGTEGLEEIYRDVLSELRSRYLLAYQSSAEEGDDRFRAVEVEVVGRDGLEARTLRGYYP